MKSSSADVLPNIRTSQNIDSASQSTTVQETKCESTETNTEAKKAPRAKEPLPSIKGSVGKPKSNADLAKYAYKQPRKNLFKVPEPELIPTPSGKRLLDAEIENEWSKHMINQISNRLSKLDRIETKMHKQIDKVRSEAEGVRKIRIANDLRD